jgi:O-antigen/teichoic acid export membrane protein
MLALTNVLNAVTKLTIGIILVLIGFSIYGAIGGVLIGFFIAIIFSVTAIGKMLFSKKSDPLHVSPVERKTYPAKAIGDNSHLWLIFNIFIAVIGLTTLTNIDVVIVKHFFSSNETALYTAASLVGRFIYFFPVGFITVMYPKVVQNRYNHSRSWNLLRKTILYTTIPTIVISIISIIFPGQLLMLMYGGQYQEATGIVMIFSPMMLIFSITSVIVNFMLALRKYRYIYIFTGISFFQIALIWFIHPNVNVILWILLVTNVINFIIALTFIKLDIIKNNEIEVKSNG